MSGSSPVADRSLIGRIGALAQQAKCDTRETTQKARDTFNSRWDREVDPDGVLPPAERTRRAAAAKKLYFTRLALKSAKARKRGPK
jgi:hypothetical protein